MAKKQGKRRGASYYIDYENVRGAGLNGVENLRAGDKVVVLYGSKDSALKLGQVQNVLNSPAEVQFIKVETGKHDALDFQLVALMFLKMKKKRDYYIVSKDTGFDFAIHMANARGMNNVYRRETISGAKLETKKLPQPKQTQSPKRLPNPKKARALQAGKQMTAQLEKPAGNEATAPTSLEGATAPAEKRPRRRRGAKQGQQATPEQPVVATAPESVPEVAQEQAPTAQPEVQAAPQAEPVSKTQQEQAPEQKPSSRRRRRKPTTSVPKPLKDQHRLDIERVLVKHLGGLPKADRVEIVLAALDQTSSKAQFYNHLRSKLGNEQGRAFYNELKGCYAGLTDVEKTAPTAATE